MSEDDDSLKKDFYIQVKIAHKTKNKEREQTLRNHSENVAFLAARNAEPFNERNEAAYIGMMHDIGKCSKEFQLHLDGGPKIDHSTAGLYEAAKTRDVVASLCIAGHHSGIPDKGTRADVEGSTLAARIRKVIRGEVPDYSGWETQVTVESGHSYACSDAQETYFKIKMLFSCLVDADYADTELFFDGTPVPGENDLDANKAAKNIENYTKKWFPPKSELNKLRCGIFSDVMSKATYRQGMYTLTVPTGGGKTVLSLAYSIRHALENTLRRVIYVAPFTSVIDQTAGIYKDILGSENILEHHSAAKLPNDSEASLTYRKISETWNMPVIATTAVQFFESMFTNMPSKSRKIHRIAKSVVIIDEVQALPREMFAPCMESLAALVRNFGVTVILCTATQPSINRLIEVFLPGENVVELCPDKYFSNPAFQRTVFKDIGTSTIEGIAASIKASKQSLCIVNSRKIARLLYDRINDDTIADECFHLSTYMYPAGRIKVIGEIRNRLHDGKPCRVISTSLIEAGVDVDFPKVYRQVCGLDSLLQSAGRCNREGKRKVEESVVYIFELPEGSPEMFSAKIAAFRETQRRYGGKLASKEAIRFYFEQLERICGNESIDINGIVDKISSGELPVAEIADLFKLIDTDTTPVVIAATETLEDIDAARNGRADRDTYRRLGLYSVNVRPHELERLEDAGRIEKLDCGIIIMHDMSAYNEKTGLDCDL